MRDFFPVAVYAKCFPDGKKEWQSDGLDIFSQDDILTIMARINRGEYKEIKIKELYDMQRIRALLRQQDNEQKKKFRGTRLGYPFSSALSHELYEIKELTIKIADSLIPSEKDLKSLFDALKIKFEGKK